MRRYSEQLRWQGQSLGEVQRVFSTPKECGLLFGMLLMVSLKCRGCSLVTERLAGKIPTRESWYSEEQAERDLDRALGVGLVRVRALL